MPGGWAPGLMASSGLMPGWQASGFSPAGISIALMAGYPFPLHDDGVIRMGRVTGTVSCPLVKSGFPLTTLVEKVVLAGKTVYSVAGEALVICLEPKLTLDLLRAIAEKKPERVVCLDEGFARNDQLKANAVQIFKTKGVTSFKTV